MYARGTVSVFWGLFWSCFPILSENNIVDLKCMLTGSLRCVSKGCFTKPLTYVLSFLSYF